MKKIVLFVLALVFSAAFAEDLKPLPIYRAIAQILARTMPAKHVSHKPLNDEISQKAWTNLMTNYDFNRMIFRKSDIDGFKAMELKIDDAIKAGDVSFGFDVFNVYTKRAGEFVNYVTNYIAKGDLDAPSDEMYDWKRKDAAWPEDVAAQEKLWRQRIRNEYMILKISKELDDEDKTRKERDERKKPDAKAVAEKKADDGKKDEDDYVEPELPPRENLLKRYRRFYTVLTEPDEEIVLQRYLSSVTMAYDPHTEYMSPRSKEEFDMDMSLSLFGVGAVLSMEDDGSLKIVDIMKGGPIDRDKRIRKGDKIIGVGQGDGPVEDVLYKPMNKTIRKIRGPKDTYVNLQIVPRKESSTHKFYKIKRDEIKLEQHAATGRVEKVTMNGVTKTFGYVKLPEFYATMDKRPGDKGYRSCTRDVSKYVAEFNACDTDGMILDLRRNGGGSLPEAIQLPALFMPISPIVQLWDMDHTHMPELGVTPPAANAFAYRKPLVVMIDRSSASASEIVAAALQDTGRAIVVGDVKSHGKGTVQTVVDFNPKARQFIGGSDLYGSLKVTTACFYRITGDSTQVKGVKSDIVVPSVLNGLDIGEDKLPNAFAWSSILPTRYPAVWNMQSYVGQLKAISDKRVAESPRGQAHKKLVDYFAKNAEDTLVTLNYAKRKDEMRLEREMREAEDPDELDEDDELDDDVVAKDDDKKKDDYVLDEAFNILHDLSRLTDGKGAKNDDSDLDWSRGLFF